MILLGKFVLSVLWQVDMFIRCTYVYFIIANKYIIMLS